MTTLNFSAALVFSLDSAIWCSRNIMLKTIVKKKKKIDEWKV